MRTDHGSSSGSEGICLRFGVGSRAESMDRTPRPIASRRGFCGSNRLTSSNRKLTRRVPQPTHLSPNAPPFPRSTPHPLSANRPTKHDQVHSPPKPPGKPAADGGQQQHCTARASTSHRLRVRLNECFEPEGLTDLNRPQFFFLFPTRMPPRLSTHASRGTRANIRPRVRQHARAHRHRLKFSCTTTPNCVYIVLYPGCLVLCVGGGGGSGIRVVYVRSDIRLHLWRAQIWTATSPLLPVIDTTLPMCACACVLL